MIKQETIRNIIDAARIDEVISEFVTLKKRGANYVGLCPFHNEKTPSFTVTPTKGIYKCFGCGKGGDVIRFVMEHDQLSYPEALKYLAGKYGIEVEETQMSEEDKQAESVRESMFVLNQFALDFFHDQMMNDEKGRAIALSYFTSRGFSEKTIEEFKLGYCPDERDSFSKKAIDAGYKTEFLEKTGLSLEKNGNWIDRFWSRVMFPIHNLSGRVIGFGGRTLRTDKKIAKYVNSPESEVYNKSRELYGLYFAKKDVVKEDICYLVEGYTDVISMHQSGVKNTVAPLGTSLTEDQVRLLRRYTSNVVLLFDSDAAGQKAAFRGIDIVLAAGLNVYVTAFPEGQDPDSFSKEHSDEELRQYLEDNRQNFIEYFLSVHKDKLNDPIKKAELMKVVLKSLSLIPDHLVRSLFVKDFAQKMQIDERTAIFELNKLRRSAAKKKHQTEADLPPMDVPPVDQQQEEIEKIDTNRDAKEEKIVELLMKYGEKEISFKVKNENEEDEEFVISVAEFIVGELENDEVTLFNELYNLILSEFITKVAAGQIPDNRYFTEHENEKIRELAYEVMSEKHTLSNNWEEKYHIATKYEENDLKTAVLKNLYALKLSEVIIRLNDFEEKMKSASEVELLFLLDQQVKLSEAKKALASKLGMTLT